MSETQEQLPLRKILIFWMPLAATWLMMAAEGPFLAAVIARLADPKFNLAAYGVAFSFAVLIEAPIIMIMSASTALVKDQDSFLKLRNFTYTLNTIITAVMLLFLLPPVFDGIIKGLIGLPEEVARITYKACWVMLPWPAAIGYRRFYQGILIADNLTRRVAYGTAIRLTSITVTGLCMFHLTRLNGAVLGGLALSISVTAEAVASRIWADKSIKKLKMRRAPSPPADPLSYPSIFKFYYPLALTSMLGLGVHPMVTFFLGKSRMSLESLAVMPVIISLTFIFRSLGLSYQEVCIALLGEQGRNLRQLRKFGFILAASASGALALIAFTPASLLWFQKVSGLSPLLADIALVPTRILVLIPALSVILSMQRGILVGFSRTAPITIATALEVVGIFAVLSFAIHGLDLVGAVGAALALLSGRMLAYLYLLIPCSKIRRQAGV